MAGESVNHDPIQRKVNAQVVPRLPRSCRETRGRTKPAPGHAKAKHATSRVCMAKARPEGPERTARSTTRRIAAATEYNQTKMLHAEADVANQSVTEGNMAPPPTRRPYYELDPQAAPEVVPSVPGAQEKTASAPRQGAAAEATGNNDTRPDEPDDQRLIGTLGNIAPGLGVSTGPSTRTNQLAQYAAHLGRPWRWARQKPYLAAAAATFGLGIVALIVLPIVLHGVALDGGDRYDPGAGHTVFCTQELHPPLTHSNA